MPVRNTSLNKSTAPTQQSPVTTVTVDETKATISYMVSYTRNLGDYNNIKVQAGLTLPINADADMLKKADEMIVVARDKVVARLDKDMEEITEGLKWL